MIGSLALRRCGVRRMVGTAERCFGRVASIDTASPLTCRSIRNRRDCFSSSLSSVIHSRQFLGCGDGKEGVLSKIYEERIVIGYSTKQLFDVAAAVDLYHGFVP